MTVRIDNIGKWTCVEEPNTVVLEADYQRAVRLDINCPSPTRIDWVDNATGVVTFLAIIQGREAVTFEAPGSGYFTFLSEAAEVWIYTVDGDGIGVETFEESLAGLENRRERNPELERMMRRMEANVAARLAVVHAALDQAVLDREFRASDNNSGATGDDKPKPEGGTTGADASAGTGGAASASADDADGKPRTDANGSPAPAK